MPEAKERRTWGDGHAAPDGHKTGNTALSGLRFGPTGVAHIGVQPRRGPVEEVAAQPMNLMAMDETGTRGETKITAGEVLAVHLKAAAIQ